MGIFKELQLMAKTFQEAGKMELYQELVGLTEENVKLREEILELKTQLKRKEEIKFMEDGYWKVDKEGNKLEGPFCPGCFASKQILALLAEFGSDTSTKRCTVCRKYFPLPQRKLGKVSFRR